MRQTGSPGNQRVLDADQMCDNDKQNSPGCSDQYRAWPDIAPDIDPPSTCWQDYSKCELKLLELLPEPAYVEQPIRFAVCSEMLEEMCEPFQLKELCQERRIPGLLEVSREALSMFPDMEYGCVPQALTIYVDGSYDDHTDLAAWSVLVFACLDGTWSWCGYMSDRVWTDSDDERALVEATNAHVAEALAVLHALWIAITVRAPNVFIRYDCTSAAGLAEGSAAPANAGALQKALAHCHYIAGCVGVAVQTQHVRAHSREPLNEMADIIAKAARASVQRVRPPKSYLHVGAARKGEIDWLWVVLRTGVNPSWPLMDKYGSSVPCRFDYAAAGESDLCPADFGPTGKGVRRVVGNDRQGHDEGLTSGIMLKLATYNALTLKSYTQIAALEEQFWRLGLHVICDWAARRAC